MLQDVNTYQLRPPVDAVFPLEEGAQAFTHLESGQQFGKVVLSA
jgi:NADPH:quinone reductase-like Zn-dependent oxidoreductase